MTEGEIFRRAWARCEATINAAGLKVETMLGPWMWRDFIREQAAKCERDGTKPPFASTSFDGDIDASLTTMNTVSLVCHADGVIRAAIVLRRYDNCLGHLIEHGGLWLPAGEILRSDFTAARMPDHCPLGARVSQRGGLFVDHGYRGSGIGAALSDGSLAAAMRLFDDDVCVGLRREDTDPHSAHVAYLGEAEIGTPRMPFWLTWSSRSDALRRFGDDGANNPLNVTALADYRQQ